MSYGHNNMKVVCDKCHQREMYLPVGSVQNKNKLLIRADWRTMRIKGKSPASGHICPECRG